MEKDKKVNENELLQKRKEGFKNFMSYVGPYRYMYERMPQALKRRGDRSLRHQLQDRSKRKHLRHIARSMQYIHKNIIPVDDEMKKKTGDFRHLSKNLENCIKYLKTDRKAATSAALVGEVINRAIKSGLAQNLASDAELSQRQASPSVNLDTVHKVKSGGSVTNKKHGKRLPAKEEQETEGPEPGWETTRQEAGEGEGQTGQEEADHGWEGETGPM